MNLPRNIPTAIPGLALPVGVTSSTSLEAVRGINALTVNGVGRRWCSGRGRS